MVRARGEALAWRHAGDRHDDIAIQERLVGKVVVWMEHVRDEQYRREGLTGVKQ